MHEICESDAKEHIFTLEGNRSLFLFSVTFPTFLSRNKCIQVHLRTFNVFYASLRAARYVLYDYFEIF